MVLVGLHLLQHLDNAFARHLYVLPVVESPLFAGFALLLSRNPRNLEFPFKHAEVVVPRVGDRADNTFAGISHSISFFGLNSLSDWVGDVGLAEEGCEVPKVSPFVLVALVLLFIAYVGLVGFVKVLFAEVDGPVAQLAVHFDVDEYFFVRAEVALHSLLALVCW